MHTGYFRTKYWCALIGHTLLQKKSFLVLSARPKWTQPAVRQTYCEIRCRITSYRRQGKYVYKKLSVSVCGRVTLKGKDEFSLICSERWHL